MAEHEDRVLAEQALAESRVLLESKPTGAAGYESFWTTLNRFRQVATCPTCGKCTQLLNSQRRGFKAETPTVDTHCVCPGGPAHHLLPSAGSGAET